MHSNLLLFQQTHFLHTKTETVYEYDLKTDNRKTDSPFGLTRENDNFWLFITSKHVVNISK